MLNMNIRRGGVAQWVARLTHDRWIHIVFSEIYVKKYILILLPPERTVCI